jgi:hypothetical protein
LLQALNKIEGSARVSGKQLTATQKKQVAALEKRLDVLMPDSE